MSNSGLIETEYWGGIAGGIAHLSFATGLAVHGLARFNRRAARRQAVDTDLRARHRSLNYWERHRGERKQKRKGRRGRGRVGRKERKNGKEYDEAIVASQKCRSE